MSRSRGDIGRLATTMGLGLLLNGCGLMAHRPWIQLAKEATGDGRTPDTAVRFSPAPRDLIMYVRSEQAWLELHGYTRIDGHQAKSALAPTRRGFFFLHTWAVRGPTGQVRTIYFDQTPMVGSPMDVN